MLGGVRKMSGLTFIPPRSAKISILMATKDRLSFLPQAIASIRAQSYKNWELLICWAGKDPTSVIPADERITTVKQTHGNLADALNQVRALATGDILHVCEDDDLMDHDVLWMIPGQLAKRRWLYGQMRTSEGELRGEDACYTVDELLHANYIPCPTVYWTREIGELVGEFDPDCCFAWDYDFWLRLMAIEPPLHLHISLAIYGIHPGQLTNTVAGTVPIHADIAREKAIRARA
jgi:glycosyltransferase involved in cell wall biosynthesis